MALFVMCIERPPLTQHGQQSAAVEYEISTAVKWVGAVECYFEVLRRKQDECSLWIPYTYRMLMRASHCFRGLPISKRKQTHLVFSREAMGSGRVCVVKRTTY